ncbi:GGDEF domain-containing protein [Candidatus Bipolaricaulota bacterium]|nr:GGDEF domain-containing protein [Candidatus Bipolaricaulota bacterium]
MNIGLCREQGEASPDTRPGTDPVERPVQAVLEALADAVLRQTLFRRVVVSLYEQPLTASASSQSRVRAYAARGLTTDDAAALQRFVAEGGTVSGARFAPEFRVGGSYYIRAGSVDIQPRVASRRRFLCPDGWHPNDLLLTPMESGDGILGVISVDDPRDGAKPGRPCLQVLQDLARMGVTALQHAQLLQEMAEQHELFRILAENCMAGFLVTQGDRLCYANERAVELFGYSRDELLAMRPWWQILHPDERASVLGGDAGVRRAGVRARAVRKDTSTVWLLVRTYPMEYQRRQAHLVDLWDITEQVQTEGMLKQKAMRDPLTGLFNRHYFDESIHGELKRSQRYGRSFTLLMADLRGFKRVNDRLGHAKGDEVLREIAHVIRKTLRESDWVIRYGGDEFLIVLPETPSPVDAVVQRLRTAVEEWNREHLPDIPLTIDVGWVTWSPESRQSIRELLEAADAQMYEDKQKRSS